MRSFRRALTLAFALFLLAPATASAATVAMNGGTMEIYAMETAPQTLTVSGEGTVTVTLTGGDILDSSSCTRDTLFQVTCNSVTQVWVDTGDGQDEVNLVDLAHDAMVVTGEGDDIIDGGDGNDLIVGGGGNDSMGGGAGNDEIDGGADNDEIDGAAGADLILGDVGDDRVDGGAGVDQIAGEEDDDILISADGEAERVECGTGIDDAGAADPDDDLDRCEETPATAGPPAVSLTDVPPAFSNQLDVVIGFEVSEPATTECRVDNGAWGGCTSPLTVNPTGDGEHTVEVRAIDLVGKQSAVQSHTWTLDTTAPVTTITAGPSGSVHAQSGEVVFSSDPGVDFECSLDGAPFQACTSPHELTGLALGKHSFEVRATDQAGNVGEPAVREFTVIREEDGRNNGRDHGDHGLDHGNHAPTVKIGVVRTKNGFRLTGAGSDVDGDGLSYEWRRDGKVVSRDAGLKVRLPRKAGRYTYTVTVTDAHGATATATKTVLVTRTVTRRRPVTRVLELTPDGWQLTGRDRAKLRTLRRHVTGARLVTIAGHTSSHASAWENRRDSRRLARMVRQKLLRGLDRKPARVVLRAYGGDKPAASNRTWPGRAENRRVVIKIERKPVIRHHVDLG